MVNLEKSNKIDLLDKTPVMHIILTETALELIPKQWKKKAFVQKQLNKYGNPAKLLDTAMHHKQMQQLPSSVRRGRPDILHHFLLDVLGSFANLHRKVAIYFDCPSGLYSVDTTMHCPRNYNRFKGLMVQMLQLGHIPPEPPYLIEKITENGLQWMRSHFKRDQTYLLTSRGVNHSFRELEAVFTSQTGDFLVLIGGFQKGASSKTIQKLSHHQIALGSVGVDSWIAVQRVITAFENTIE